ncbi:MAG: DUF1491 family protein [Aestuariivita sp.]|nr:DUF1491 family protein [Aestuariivita sp.]MCY4201209.1 DUF1491 family protein [Aestuariivita sp.]MCY4288987.1 DUF1491 family protein [Aestuariivita sp.]MCY4346576.1 DUF1491 family protein [Aestuariivita sp.]
MTRLSSQFWVQAYFKRLQLAGISGYVVIHGDDTAGAILVKLNTLDGNASAYQRSIDPSSGNSSWMLLNQTNEAEIDASIRRQCALDPDLWVLEIEDRSGRHLLD